MSYVRLKHALSALALDAVDHPDHAWVADALLAYAQSSHHGPRVSIDALARAGRVTAAETRRALEATGLFTADGDGALALGPAFRPFLAYLSRQAARTATAARRLRAPRPATVPAEIWRAAALFNAGLFFECHEYLEDVWRATQGPDREFYHGLVQAAAGCYHLEKGNVHGARTLLGKAVAKLEPYAPSHRALDLAAFLAGLRRVLSRIDGATPRVGETVIPALELAGSSHTSKPRPGAESTLPPREPSG